MKQKIKVAGLIEYPIFQLGLAKLLQKLNEIDYLGNTDRKNAVPFVIESAPDILMVNTRKNLPGEEKLIRDLHALTDQLKIAVFLNSPDGDLVRKYLELAVSALILKSSDHSELKLAIKSIIQSGLFISQGISSGLLNSVVNISNEAPKRELSEYRLSKREIQVMLMIYREYTNPEIGSMLGISQRTVESHRTRIMRKIGVKNSIGIAKFVIRNKLDDNLRGGKYRRKANDSSV